MEIFLILLSVLISFAVALLAIPPIVRVAEKKHLFDVPDGRKIHDRVVPPLGGVAIFLGFVLASIIATDGLSFDILKYIIASVILVFFIGLKDDLMAISARLKFIVQIVAATLLITLANVRITNFHGLFGIYGIDYPMSFVISLLVIVFIINNYNLIDGIDGLASGLGIIASSAFGFWFFAAGHIQFSILAFALTGSLSAFFIINVFGRKYKMFMGDTGSLIVGLVISTLLIFFNEFSIEAPGAVSWRFAPLVSVAVVSIPLLDTLRVMSIRIARGQSPFTADNNHLHHRLLALVPSHKKVTFILLILNISLIRLAIELEKLEVRPWILSVFFLSILASLSVLISQIVRFKKRREKQLQLRKAW